MIKVDMVINQRKHMSRAWDFFELNDILYKLCNGVNLAYAGGMSNLHNRNTKV